MTNALPVFIYTDGSCLRNPDGPGGWSVVLQKGLNQVHTSGFEPNTTNNRMEMMAALSAMRLIRQRELRDPIVIHSDSKYVINGMTEWISGWKRRGWFTSAGKEVLNRDLWEQMHQESQGLRIQWRWVRGHAGHPGNELADQLARTAARQQKAFYKEWDGLSDSQDELGQAPVKRNGSAIHLDLSLSDQVLAEHVRNALMAAKGKSVRFRQSA